MIRGALAEAFVKARGRAGDGPAREDLNRQRLEERLLALCERAEATALELPLRLSIPRPVFAAYLGAHAAVAEGVEAGRDLDDDALGELLLACALGRGDPAAMEHFDRRYVARLDAVLAKMRLGPAMLDDVKQHVREKLLVKGADGELRLDTYAGRGRLEGLVNVVASRKAVELLRRERREAPADDDDFFDRPAEGRTPELEVLRARCSAELRRAFEEAVRSLPRRERNVLRLHLLGGVTLDRLAEMYGVHRATIVRWLSQARRHILVSTKKGLSEKVRVRPEELESLIDLVQSRLTLSVERILQTMDTSE